MATPISNLTATWSDSSQTYNAIGMNVTTTNYADDSTLFNLKTNGDSQFSVDPYGNINFTGNITTPGEMFVTNVITTSINTVAINVTTIDSTSINLNGVSLASSVTGAYDGVGAAYDKANAANILAYTANTTNISQNRIEQSFNTTGTAPYFPVRAWLRFTAANPPVMIANGNILSLTRTAIGNYRVVFKTPLPSDFYAVVGSCLNVNDNIIGFNTSNASNCIITVFDNAGGAQDQGNVSAIFVC